MRDERVDISRAELLELRRGLAEGPAGVDNVVHDDAVRAFHVPNLNRLHARNVPTVSQSASNLTIQRLRILTQLQKLRVQRILTVVLESPSSEFDFLDFIAWVCS